MLSLNLSIREVSNLVEELRSSALLTTSEVAVRLDVEPEEVRRWAAEGLLPGEKVGGRFVFRLGDVIRWELKGLQQLAGDRQDSGLGVLP